MKVAGLATMIRQQPGLASSPLSIGISYSPAGLLTPYHFGITDGLKKHGFLAHDTNDMSHSHIRLTGASGGALAAVTAALNLPVDRTMEACLEISDRCSVEGTRGTLRLALDESLEKLLPKDAHITLSSQKIAAVAYTEIHPSFATPHIVDTFLSRDDLIDTLRASCNIPFYFDGNSFGVKVRDIWAVDGFFASNRRRFGCPETYATREFISCPFPPDLVGLNPQPNKAFEPSSSNSTASTITSTEGELQKSLQKKSPQTLETIVLAPQLYLPEEENVLSFVDLVSLALQPPTTSIKKKFKSGQSAEVYQKLYDMGLSTVDYWYESQSKNA